MDRQVKVSIILPSLNVKKYIRECIESVINQSLQDIEIICVDAGSTDGTLEIIREYEAKDTRIKVIVSDKKSYGYQMNLGMATAIGEYIGIVETDDFICERMYEEFYSIAKEYEADFVKSDYYNFTGEGNELKKELFCLPTDKTFYNRIINIEEERECFRFPINTWTGIYNRKFLQEHNICHNETPGASFQDNGFWFLGFVYAKRVLFLDKPYYMHRKDNPNSSANNREKVFCICDEFKFIRDVLKKDEKVFQEFKYTYTVSCFDGYMHHLGRISHEYKKSFLEKFAQDFRFFQEQGELDQGMFGDGHILFSIMESPEHFYQQYFLPKKKLYDMLQNYQNIIIYGAGKVGVSTFHELVDCGLSERILCFAVSEKKENPSVYERVSICEIYDLREYCENSLVIIATAQKYQAQIYRTLETLNFKHIITVTELRNI